MRPILFVIGGYGVRAYGAFTALGYATAIAVLASQRRRMGADWDRFIGLILTVLVAGLAGARLGALVFYRTGFSFYQGFWCAALAGWLYCRSSGLDAARVADGFGLAVPAAHVVGRLGCWLNGCCYGRPTDLPWSMPLRGGAVHPTQLYDAVGNAVLALWLLLRVRPAVDAGRLRPGAVGWSYVLGYAGLRFGLEFLRGDAPGRFDFILTTAQWTAAAGAALACRGLRRGVR